MFYVVKTLEGKPMAGAYSQITNIETAREYARGMIFTAQLPEIQSMEIYADDGVTETLVEVVV